LGGTGELFWRPNDTPRGVREHHGGHGTHMAHPEISRVWNAAAERDIQIPRELWDRLSHHSTFHVDQQFEGLLDKKLRKVNNAGQAAFTQAIGAIQSFIDDHDRKQTTASDLRSNAPFKMMESKKEILNNKIKYLIETSEENYDDEVEFDERGPGNYREDRYEKEILGLYDDEDEEDTISWIDPKSILMGDHPLHSNNVQQYPVPYLQKAKEHLELAIRGGSKMPEHQAKLNIINQHLN